MNLLIRAAQPVLWSQKQIDVVFDEKNFKRHLYQLSWNKPYLYVSMHSGMTRLVID